MNRCFFILMCLVFSPNIFASSATGLVGKLLVGRSGHEIYVELIGAAQTCETDHPLGFNYSLSLNDHPMGKEILSVLLAAQISEKKITVQGASICSIDFRMEDVSYIYLSQ